MRIPYTATNFPVGSPSQLVGSASLTASWTDIVWSAITAGKPGASHLLAHRWHSFADLVVRSHTVYASLRQRGQSVDRSSLYDSLDPTEKGATSYFMGMAMAKLFASELFDTPWLFHVSMASAVGASLSYKRGSKSQPDLIGQNSSGGWIVVEAKGRTNGLDSVALTKAKAQTEMIRTINGLPPSLRVALQVFFTDHMAVRIDDPSDARPDALEINLDMNTALSRYYAVAKAITTKPSTREVVRQQEFETVFDEDAGITIGLDSELLDRVSAGEFEQIQEKRIGLSPRRSEEEDGATIYPDGLLVRLDSRWSSQLMSLEPEARGG